MTNIETSLRLLFEPGDVFEIRILDAERPGYRRPHIESGYFDYDHIADVPQTLAEITTAMGIYITMNPVNPALLARSANRLKTARRNDTTSDTDILRRRWFLIDIDPERPSGISATDTEKQLALEKAMEIRDGLTSMGWPQPVTVDSGNGYYLLYRVDLPADDDGLIHRCIKALQPVNSDAVHVDTSVANAARICRLPGTWNRKGEDMPDRPHRQSEIVAEPEQLETVDRSLLVKLATPPETPKALPEKRAGGGIGDSRPGDVYNDRGDLRGLLAGAGWQHVGGDSQNEHWRRPGKATGNHSATFDGTTFYVFSSAAAPFEPNTGYSPFAVYALLNHNGDHTAAAQALAADGYGDPRTPQDDSDVDLSYLLAKFQPDPEPEDDPSDLLPENPGILPPELLNVPGLIGEITAWTLATAPYPNTVLSFAGALAMMSWLTGRKVRTPGGLRTNLYLVAIAESGVGKDWPRKANVRILADLGAHNAWALDMASGEAVQDALDATPCLLTQPDEIDTLIKSIAADNGTGGGGGRFLRLSATLMELYTSADSLYACRRLANAASGRRHGQDHMPRVIDQPHLVLFSAATPDAFFSSISEQLISRGFLSRCLILDTPDRGDRQRARAMDATPEAILDQARAWYEWKPTQGNLADEHPRAVEVPMTADAHAIIDQCGTDCDARYAEATSAGKPIWSRCAAMAEQLALLHACSQYGPGTSAITAPSATWGVKVAEHLAQRLLWHVSRHVADGAFGKLRLRVLRLLEDAGGQVSHRKMLRQLKVKVRELQEVIDSLIASEEVEHVMMKGKSRSIAGYRRIA